MTPHSVVSSGIRTNLAFAGKNLPKREMMGLKSVIRRIASNHGPPRWWLVGLTVLFWSAGLAVVYRHDIAGGICEAAAILFFGAIGTFLWTSNNWVRFADRFWWVTAVAALIELRLH